MKYPPDPRPCIMVRYSTDQPPRAVLQIDFGQGPYVDIAMYRKPIINKGRLNEAYMCLANSVLDHRKDFSDMAPPMEW